MAISYQNIDFDTYIVNVYCYKVLTCIYNLTDGETFTCGIALTLFAAYAKQNWFAYYIGSVVFIGSNILYNIGYRNIGKKSLSNTYLVS